MCGCIFDNGAHLSEHVFVNVRGAIRYHTAKLALGFLFNFFILQRLVLRGPHVGWSFQGETYFESQILEIYHLLTILYYPVSG